MRGSKRTPHPRCDSQHDRRADYRLIFAMHPTCIVDTKAPVAIAAWLKLVVALPQPARSEHTATKRPAAAVCGLTNIQNLSGVALMRRPQEICLTNERLWA